MNIRTNQSFVLACLVLAPTLVGCGVSRAEFDEGIAGVQRSIEEREQGLTRQFSQGDASLQAALQAQVEELQSWQNRLEKTIARLDASREKLATRTASLESELKASHQELSAGTSTLKGLVHERFVALEHQMQSHVAQSEARLSEIEKYDEKFRHSIDLAQEERDMVLEELVRFVDTYTSMLQDSTSHINAARGALQERLDRATADSATGGAAQANVAADVVTLPASTAQGSADSQ